MSPSAIILILLFILFIFLFFVAAFRLEALQKKYSKSLEENSLLKGSLERQKIEQKNSEKFLQARTEAVTSELQAIRDQLAEEKTRREQSEQIHRRLLDNLDDVDESLENYKESEQEKIKIFLSEWENFEREKINQSLNLFSTEICSKKDILTSQLNQTSIEVEKYQKLMEDLAGQYSSAIEGIRNATLSQEEQYNNTINLSQQSKDDIEFLLSNVLTHLFNPTIISKLIWTEYYQKPMKELLNRICEEDGAGIYKITHIPTQRSYVGRTTSIRSRLQEHVKSSIGIGTIAHQPFHDEMSRLGIWNFRFEVLEKCDKEKLSEREKFYIKTFNSQVYGFNSNSGG